MKRFILYLSVIIVFLLVACGSTSEANPNNVVEGNSISTSSSYEFINSNNEQRAKTLSVNIDKVGNSIQITDGDTSSHFGEIIFPSHAHNFGLVYNWRTSANQLAKIFFGEETSYTISGDELCTDNAKLVVKDSSVHYYSTNSTIKAIKETIPYTVANFPTQGYQEAGIRKSDYSIFDLDFMSSIQAANEVKMILERFIIGEIKLVENYTLDAETMNVNLQKKLNYMRETAADIYDYQYKDISCIKFTELDECYFFSFRVKLDELEVFGAPSSTAAQVVSGVKIHCLYGQSGILDLTCENLPSSYTKTESYNKLADPTSVITNAMLALPMNKQTELVSIELCYASVNDEHLFQPVWIICYCYDSHLTESKSFVKYEYVCIDAVTNEVLKYEMPRS